MKKTIFCTTVILTVIFMLRFAGSVIHYTRAAMEMCYEIIIPTLFPFFVCSGLLIYSGFGSVLAKAASGFMRPLFNVAPSGAAAFALGIISGFPLGAVTAVQLYQCGSLSKSEAERLLAFCNNSGPLFIIGSVGTAIYSKPIYGIALYIIHIISSLLVGIAFRFYSKNRHNSPPMRLDTTEMPLTEVFTTALTNAAKNIITVCFAIIFFSALCRAVLDVLPLSPALYAIVSGICEFSTGTLRVSVLDYGIYEKLVITAFILGFSGLCVHIQVMASVSGSGLSLKPYMLGKCLHGMIAAAITAAVLRIMPVSAPTFSGCDYMLSASFAVIPLLIAASAAFVFILFLIRRLIIIQKR
ncbi:MAG: hypothetical protein J1G06_01250 [Oscillospiraceae bacterium]|nr:hypothetical protein [Oscillospiraceae bacterium]